MSQELREKIIEDCLVNRKLIINDKVDDHIIELHVMQIIKFNEEDDAEEASEANSINKTFNRKDDPIRIYIHSPGGKVVASLALISAIETSKTPVHTYCLGQASSAAAIILLSGHKRFIQKYSTVMIHEMSFGAHGALQDMKEVVYDTKRLQKIYDSIITSKTKIKQNTLDEIYGCKRDWTLTSTEALRLKIVDEFF